MKERIEALYKDMSSQDGGIRDDWPGSLKNEVWKTVEIEGFKGLYEASNMGRIRSWMTPMGGRPQHPHLIIAKICRDPQWRRYPREKLIKSAWPDWKPDQTNNPA